MANDWRNAFGILMCAETCDGASAGICNGAPSTCSSFSMKTYEVLLMSIPQHIFAWRDKKNILWIPLLSEAMCNAEL